MLILPGQISFFLFLSLVPTITLIGYACSYLNISNNFDNTIYSRNIGLAGFKHYLKNETTTADNLSVMYLRPSQAERMRNK